MSNTSPPAVPDADNNARQPGLTHRILAELGLTTLAQAHRDVKLLCLTRFVRRVAYGGSTLVLVSYLEALGVSKTRAGLFLGLTLAGDVGVSFLLTLVADRVGRKLVLTLGACLMVVSGLVFGLVGNYWVLLAAAVLGVICPNGAEIGPFKAVEESVLAHLTVPETRSDVYTWHNLLGQLGTALGLVVCGWVSRGLMQDADWSAIAAYRTLFFAYAGIGLVKLVLALLLSDAVETEMMQKQRRVGASTDDAQDGQGSEERRTGDPSGETEPLLGRVSQPGTAVVDGASGQGTGWAKMLLPEISKSSLSVVITLCMLMSLDSFAGGLISIPWLNAFFHEKFDLDDGQMGSIISASRVISALSTLVASSIARRIGTVKTMIFTHLPSSIILALIPLPPQLPLAVALLVIRAGTQSMDRAPRTAFIAASVFPGERTAVMGIVNVVKTSAQTAAPLVTGVLADQGLFWLAFVLAGALKVTYDFGILFKFLGAEERRRQSYR